MNILSAKCLNKNGIIIIHRHKNEKDMLAENFKVIEQKIYGLSKIIFLSF
jgi:16S rRNA (guanine966-N2)-methyltransferase